MSISEAKQTIAVINSLKLTSIASENVSAFSVITKTGKVADSTNLFHKNIIMGITIATILNGFPGTVVTAGQVINPLWSWTRGNIIYLNGTALSTTAPSTGFRVMIGQALSATAIDISISESIIL